jgi:phenylpropionate dioxygenase-like ring-hydroxylating dioxygenase large terminal subunit
VKGRGSVLSNVDPALRRGWHPVARSKDVSAQPLRVRLLDEDWVLVRLPDGEGSERLAAYLDRCPHRLAPLSAGWVDGTALRCGYHGWCFDADGACVGIPSLGADHRPSRSAATKPAGVAEHLGVVFVAPDPPLGDLLGVPEDGDPTFARGDLPVMEAAVGAGLMLDNFLDMAHFPFVHAATIGAPEASIVDGLEISRDGFGMTVRSEHPFPNHEDPGVGSGIRPLLQHRRLTYTYRAPFSISLRIDYVEAGGSNVLSFFVQPVDASTCRLFTSIFRNDLGDDAHRMADAIAFEEKVISEDLTFQERYVHKTLPLDLSREVHVKSDRATVELRRILADFVEAASRG